MAIPPNEFIIGKDLVEIVKIKIPQTKGCFRFEEKGDYLTVSWISLEETINQIDPPSFDVN